MMNNNRKITGVIKEDRIWEQWYDEELLKTSLPKMNQTDYLLKSNKGFEQNIIINNRGKKSLTLNMFNDRINLITSSLINCGIKKGDIISSVALSTPDLVALKYAATSIGAITANLNFADATSNLDCNKMYKQLVKIQPKIIFVLDILENKVSELLNINEFKDIKKIILPLTNYTNILNSERILVPILKAQNKIKKLHINSAINFNRFLKNGDKNFKIEKRLYCKDMPANIAFTSGTTGDSKAVLLSHDANNALAYQHKIANLKLNRGEKNLALVPPFLAFWDSDIIHMAMCMGIEEILDLSLTYDKIPEYLKKYHPNYGIWSQYLWDSLLHMDKEDIKEISTYLKKVVVGGERAEKNQIKTFEKITGITQEAGYGATEMNTCFSVANPRCNIVGSSGIPLPFNNLKILDNSGKELTYNQRGKVYLTGPAQMLGYYDDDEKTKQVLSKDENGITWYNTNDYGYLDEYGSLHILDRYQEPIKIDSQLVNIVDVNEAIKACPYVKICKTNYANDKLVTFVVFDEFADVSKEEMLKSLKLVIDNLKEKPNIIRILKTLPRTQVGKVDYALLKEETEQLTSIYTNAVIADSLEKVKKLKRHV